MPADFEQHIGGLRESAERLKALDLKGSIVPLITPRNDNDPYSIDQEGLANLFEFQIRNGTNGIFILGTTGEFRNLTLDQKKIVIEIAGPVVNTRVPLIVGVSAETPSEIADITKFAHERRVDALVVAPLYTKKNSLTETLDAVVDNTDLPWLLYNNPGIHGDTSILPSIAIAREKYVKQLVGIKDSSSDEEVFSAWLNLRSEQFRVFAGTYYSFRYGLDHGGIDGWVLAEANYSPQSFSWRTVMPDGKTPNEHSLRSIAQICQPQEDFIKATKQRVYETGLIKSPSLFP